ncbi:MAG: enoyl-CoA hydratase/isomerase family protein [Candidatus Hydrogenedentes bacterium]|nr:enoyl-CoA hydratase/isomerase family protein [Candidatus Hydrogenedentota bacterium]
MGESFIHSRQEGPIFYITLARADKRNALTIDMMEDIAAAALKADELADVRAILLTAEGPIFSAGIDIMALAGFSQVADGLSAARLLRRGAGRLQECLNVLEATELPVIGVLQGQVIGLGLELALACDLRVGASDLKMSIPESRMGLVADVGGTTRLCRAVGPSRAKDLLMTARSLEADEALQWGLLNRVAPLDELMATAEKLAADIARNAPLAVGAAKLLVDQGDGLDRHTQMALERWAQSQLITSGDCQEAFMAFMEKRPPSFKAR